MSDQKLTPAIGDRRRGHEIGYTSGRHLYEWHACAGCGVPRWARIERGEVARPKCPACGHRAGRQPRRLPPLRPGGPQVGDTAGDWQIGRRSPSGVQRKYRWTACVDCGWERWVIIGYGRRWAPSPRCRKCANRRQAETPRVGPENGRWAGGRYVMKTGYVTVWVSPDDPMSAMIGPGQNSRHVLEHRLVMARELGRPLRRREVVHHRNGVRSDNRIENLQLFPSQRAHRLWEAAIARAAKLAVVPPAVRVDPGPDYAWQPSLF